MMYTLALTILILFSYCHTMPLQLASAN